MPGDICQQSPAVAEKIYTTHVVPELKKAKTTSKAKSFLYNGTDPSVKFEFAVSPGVHLTARAQETRVRLCYSRASIARRRTKQDGRSNYLCDDQLPCTARDPGRVILWSRIRDDPEIKK
jgi:hypothetical protein